MVPEKKREIPFRRVYLYMLAFGFMLFGIFAIYFPTYDHPYYGHIHLGEYHKFIGVAFLLLSVACMLYLRRKD
jgi:hypothetical protein